MNFPSGVFSVPSEYSSNSRCRRGVPVGKDGFGGNVESGILNGRDDALSTLEKGRKQGVFDKKTARHLKACVLLALGFQAFLIMIVVGIYAVLIRNISGAADIAGAIWGCMGYTVLLCFCLFKTGSISKSVFGAH